MTAGELRVAQRRVRGIRFERLDRRRERCPQRIADWLVGQKILQGVDQRIAARGSCLQIGHTHRTLRLVLQSQRIQPRPHLVMNLPGAIFGKELRAREKRRERYTRDIAVRQQHVDRDEEIGSRAALWAQNVGEHGLDRITIIEPLLAPRFEREQPGSGGIIVTVAPRPALGPAPGEEARPLAKVDRDADFAWLAPVGVKSYRFIDKPPD